jgi:hypothetical protein
LSVGKIGRHCGNRFQQTWCGQTDSNRHSAFAPRDFLPATAFAALPSGVRARLVRGLDYTFIVRAFAPLDAVCLVSIPSPGCSAGTLGSGSPCERFPGI